MCKGTITLSKEYGLNPSLLRCSICGKGTITLSKEYGLNPSLLRCSICGKDIGVAILGHNGGKEAPQAITTGELCDECKEKYADYVRVMEVDGKEFTGRMLWIRKSALNVECPDGVAVSRKTDFKELLALVQKNIIEEK